MLRISDDEYRADSPNIPLSPGADTSMDQPYNPVSPPHDAPSSSRSPPQVQDPDTSSPRYRENDDDEKSNVVAKSGSENNDDADDDRSEKRKSPAGSDAEDGKFSCFF
ncbi:unnamed protein product [Cylicostephanus goldi]|uniref:Uncharacterized protein n=1 Tax=Cylicostephanus goldi TaxID=71465 RepID=A0A3P6SSV9_CYLGO|nr:unnamed protein product [Cylicostephanus goldi]